VKLLHSFITIYVPLCFDSQHVTDAVLRVLQIRRPLSLLKTTRSPMDSKTQEEMDCSSNDIRDYKQLSFAMELRLELRIDLIPFILKDVQLSFFLEQEMNCNVHLCYPSHCANAHEKNTFTTPYLASNEAA